MAESAQALYGHEISCDRSTMPQTIERRHACAQNGGRFDRRKSVWNCCHCFLPRDHVLSVSAVFLESGHLEVSTTHEVATPTRIALTTMSTMPTHTHPLTLLPRRDARANLVDHSGHLMPRDARVL
jgi:hypothetical protein